MNKKCISQNIISLIEILNTKYAKYMKYCIIKTKHYLVFMFHLYKNLNIE